MTSTTHFPLVPASHTEGTKGRPTRIDAFRLGTSDESYTNFHTTQQESQLLYIFAYNTHAIESNIYIRVGGVSYEDSVIEIHLPAKGSPPTLVLSGMLINQQNITLEANIDDLGTVQNALGNIFVYGYYVKV